MRDLPVHTANENDAFRKDALDSLGTDSPCQHIRVSDWVNTLTKEQKQKLLKMIHSYTDWSPETDLRQDHSAGVIEFEGHTVLWLIRYYDPVAGAVLTIEPNLYRGLFIKHSAEI